MIESTKMMKYRKIEVAILSAKRERNLQRMEDIKMILEHKTRILDMEADQSMKRSGFTKSQKFKDISEEYSLVQRLHRLTQAYAWS
jgi:phosphosulfolactate synthase (CoM biosynthesis protein A)